jgi:hypothetical protein
MTVMRTVAATVVRTVFVALKRFEKTCMFNKRKKQKFCSFLFAKEVNMDILIVTKLFESIGFPAVIFVIWYIYHQAQVKTFENLMNQNFAILKDLLETNQYHAAILSRIENKIDTNYWCPILKKEVSKINEY